VWAAQGAGALPQPPGVGQPAPAEQPGPEVPTQTPPQAPGEGPQAPRHPQ
jgi:hypothetical protein